MIKLKIKISILLLSIFVIYSFSSINLSAEWITKKSDKSKELSKVDDMYSKGFLTKSECTKMKAKLLNITNATGMCDDVADKKITKSKKTETTKSNDWKAEYKQPKSSKIFTSSKVSNEKDAKKIALRKCYDFVAKVLNKKDSKIAI